VHSDTAQLRELTRLAGEGVVTPRVSRDFTSTWQMRRTTLDQSVDWRRRSSTGRLRSPPGSTSLDTARLSQADRDGLKELVASHPEWAGKVVIY